MRTTFKRLFALALTLVMILSLMPLQSHAAHSHTHEETASATRSITGGTYVLAANVGGTYYALPNSFAMTSSKILGQVITLTNGAVSAADAATYGVTVAAYGGNFTIFNGTKYLKYNSSTNLATATTPYEWAISTGTNGSYRITASTDATRGLVFRSSEYNQFGGYAVSNIDKYPNQYYDIELLPVSGGGDSGGGDSGGDTQQVVSTASIANGEYVVAANVAGTYYAMDNTFAAKITGTPIVVTDGYVDADAAVSAKVTVSKSGDFHTISANGTYLTYSDSTNLGSSTTAYHWAIISGVNGTYRAVASTDNSRGIAFQQSTTRFGGYALSNVTAGSTSYYDIELLPVKAGSGSGDSPTAPVIEDGRYVIAAFVNGTYYAMSNYFAEKIPGTGIIVANGCVTEEAAADYVVNITRNGEYYLITNETGYLRYVSSTNLGYSASTTCDWSITSGTNGTYRISAASTLTASTIRSLAYRTDTYNTFGAYATSNIVNNPSAYYDVELLPVGDPDDYKQKVYTLVKDATSFTAGNYIFISQAINSNNAFYAMTTAQEPGYYYMTSQKLNDTELPQNIVINAKDATKLSWTMTGTRTSFKLQNAAGTYLANSATAARLNLSATGSTWSAAYSSSKQGFHLSANKYYVSLRDDTTTTGANGHPMFGGVAVTTTPPGHIYMNVYKECLHTSVSETNIPATCIESGFAGSTCNTCGTVISSTTYPATGHTIVYTSNGAGTHLISCQTCGYEEGTENCVYSNLACYRCGNPEPENDYSGRYYFAAVRSSEGSSYHYMTFDLVGASTKRYASEDSGLSTLPAVITAPVSNKVYVIEKNDAGTYRIFAEGLAGDNCLAWEADANASENSGAFADTFNAYELTIGLSGEATDGNKIVNIYFVENDLPRYLSLNNTTGNNYFAWYTSASSQRRDIVLVPAVGEATCLHTNRTTVVTEPTCTVNGYETIYCADCGAIVGEEELLAPGHSLQYQWVEEGWHYASCTQCDFNVTEECTLVGLACMYCSGGDLECFQLVMSPSELSTDRYIIIAKNVLGDYGGDYSYYGLNLHQDSNYNAMSTQGMVFDELPTEIYIEGTDTANLVWNLTGSVSGFTLTTDSGAALCHSSGNDLILGNDTPSTWTGDFSTTEGHFAVKHNNSYYMSLRTDWNTLDNTDNGTPLINCVNNTDTGNYKMFFYKKYDGCLHINTSTTIVEPTCTTGGSETVVCDDCKQTISSTKLDPYGHDPFAYPATEPTCTVAGNVAYWYCADCDCYFSDELCSKKTTPEAIAIAPLGHNWDDGQITVSPTCTSAGTMTYTCYTCTGTKTEVLSALGHFYTRVVTAPTCTAQGYTTFTCHGCGDSYKGNYTEAFGHNYTYKNNGNGTHTTTCDRGCGYSATETCTFVDEYCVCGAKAEAACTHSKTTTNTVQPTCTTAGSNTVVCSECGVTISTTAIPATGHSLTAVVAKSATCTEPGCQKHWHCGKCNSYFADADGKYSLPEDFVIIAALGHNYTYTNNGMTHTVTCANGCDHNVTEIHSYTNGICVCGAEEKSGDLTGRYYIAAKRNTDTNYHYILSTMDGTRYDIADSGVSVLPNYIPSGESNKIFVIEKSSETTYRIYAEGISGDAKYLGWTSGNTGSFVTVDNALNLTIDALTSGLYNIHFTSGTEQRFLSLNASTANSYAAWYKTGQIKNLALIPVDGASQVYEDSLKATMAITVGAEMAAGFTVMNSVVGQYKDFYLVVEKDVVGGEKKQVIYGFEAEHQSFTPMPPTGTPFLYNCSFVGITAKEMGDEIRATLYAIGADGTLYYGPTEKNSIKNYLINGLSASTTTAAQKTMYVDMLKYGAVAQTYFGYDTDNLVTDDLTTAQLAYGTQSQPAATNYAKATGSGKILNTSVVLKARVVLSLSTVYPGANVSNMKFVIRDAANGQLIKEIPATTNGVMITADFDDVGAKQMRRLITATLYDGTTAVTQTATWSVESYVASVRATSKDPGQVDLVNAMLTYGDAVAAYMTSIGK